ncbi:Serine/threonine-protein kinase PrkC [Aquisphaera giovannonii]|uniref:Serine/threonine-protein kinase PrkC n=1 Tax=Aquisphaera giovannonii TaxID=406548 RepID=A0A5B9WB09_9BACT|nr:serine/threonine-protein kinase [Aquisphaera giovannonii]QEH37667.1 Serine/threonine-protein kinase PrkC [Aquisphaera giovannonii]
MPKDEIDGPGPMAAIGDAAKSDRSRAGSGGSRAIGGHRLDPAGMEDEEDAATLRHAAPGPAPSDPSPQERAGLPRVGSDFLGFQLLKVLGKGAFGVVYLARQAELADRLVVLKVTSRRDDEPRILAQLQHTNIVPIYSIHVTPSHQVVCMPYFGATTLDDVGEHIRSQDKLPETGFGLISSLIENRSDGRSDSASRPEMDAAPAPRVSDPDRGDAAGDAAQAGPSLSDDTLDYLKGLTYVEAVLWVGSRLASGLAHAHERRILHLDLKPANVLLTDEGQPMLLDLNLSMDLKQAGAPTPPGGTVLYMSPEQLDAFQSKTGEVDGRSDIYSLGVMLFELLTRRRHLPLSRGSSRGIVDGVIASRKAPSPPVRCWNKAVTPAVESIIRHCLEPDPARRYRDARELQEDIDRHLSNLPLRHAREPSLLERGAKWRRRHPTLASSATMAFVATICLVLACSMIWVALSDGRRDRAILGHLRFREDFQKSQLLLNTAHDGSTGHLMRGLEVARSAMAPYLDEDGRLKVSAPAFQELPGPEQASLRSDLAELILLEVRARIALAEQSEPAPRRGETYLWALDRLGCMRSIDRHLPSAFYQDRARLLAAIGRPVDAERDRRRGGRIRVRNARDHYLLGTSLLAQRQGDRAEPLLSRAVALDPRQFWAWFALGICHSDQGRNSDAAGDFAICTALVPQLAWPYLNRGLCLARCGRLTEAVTAYDQALRLDPGLAEARVDRGLALLELGHPDRALVDLDRAVASDVVGPAARAARAESLSRLGRHAESEAAFSELIAQSPGDPTPLVARGFSRLQRDPAGAAADFGRALELDPKNARAYLGRAHLARPRDQRAALAEAERALAIDPDFGDALQLRALIRAHLNDPGAEADVDRLLRVPTPQGLYNAACAMSILSRGRAEARYRTLSIRFLERALQAGLAPDNIADDPDLAPLAGTAEFLRILQALPRRPKAGTPALR